MSSKLLEAEVRHFRLLPEGHADKNYAWLRDMIDKVLQLEKEDKNQADLQAAHRAPIGSRPGAATKGKDGKGNKKKGKGKGENRRQGSKGQGGDSQGASDSPGRASTGSKGSSSGKGKTPRDTSKIPCKFLFMFGDCKKGIECNFSHRVPTAEEIVQFGLKKAGERSPKSGASGSSKDKPCFAHGQGTCKFGKDCIFSHDPAVLAKHQAARAKSKGRSKGKSPKKGAPAAQDSE